ncbi:hypothetical protein [Haloarcula halophila]|nr:hypothetical protein [Halomicroarcula sp. DFY41]
MTQRPRIQDSPETAEPKFYLPAGSTAPLVVDRLESVWATLFDNGVAQSR